MSGSSRGGWSDWPQERPRRSPGRDGGRSYPDRARGAEYGDGGYDDREMDEMDDDGGAYGRGDDEDYGGGYDSPSRSGARRPGGRNRRGEGSAGGPGRGGGRAGRYDEAPDGGATGYGASGGHGGYGSAAPTSGTRRGGGQDYGRADYGRRGPPSGGRAGYGDAWSDGHDGGPGYDRPRGQVYGADSYRQGADRDQGAVPGAGGDASHGWRAGNNLFTQPPASDPLFGYEPAEVAAKKSRRNRALTVVLSLLLVLGLLGGGAVFVVEQIAAPAAMVGLFCGDLKTKQYASAYALLGGGAKAAVTGSQFAGAMGNLDTAQGAVTQCGLAAGTSLGYRLLGTVASGDLTLTRATAGTLRGAIHLTNQSGAWRLDQMDEALFGVSLGAAGAFSTYCADVENQLYDDAYTLFTADIQSKITKESYAAQEQMQDGLDGKVGVCHLTGIGPDASSAATNLSASITRATLGERKGSFTLKLENGAWKIARIETQLLGTDLGPLVTTARLCHDLAAADYLDAYGLFTANWTGGDSEAGFATVFDGDYNGVKWDGCDVDLKTYSVSGTTASVVATFTIHRVSSPGSSGSVKFKMVLVAANGVWKIDDWQQQ